jgi:PIN domain nuclease of toxin-antitoxin system
VRIPHISSCVGELPWRHRDLFDRLLVPQALAEKLSIVSSDPALAQYGVDVSW